MVIGIINAPGRRQDVTVSQGYAKAKLGLRSPENLIVETQVGGAEVVGGQLGLALRPNQPSLLSIAIPPSS